uniref:Thymidylate synthase n=1 Tax=Periophthalmus magnuspinnatus TaxID=409849 RepID=A0A3B4ACA6_9GOBI
SNTTMILFIKKTNKQTNKTKKNICIVSYSCSSSAATLSDVLMFSRDRKRTSKENKYLANARPVYGFQWRPFGKVINTIKTNSEDRRIVMCGWNPKDLPLMALPSFHALCQLYVCDGEMSCQLYQHSGDMGLGVRFSITYELLMYMITHITGLKPEDFTHIYINHREKSTPLPNSRSFESWSVWMTSAQKTLKTDYSPRPVIKMQMDV